MADDDFEVDACARGAPARDHARIDVRVGMCGEVRVGGVRLRLGCRRIAPVGRARACAGSDSVAVRYHA